MRIAGDNAAITGSQWSLNGGRGYHEVMEATPAEHAVLACLTVDERKAAAVLAEAERLAQELKAPLSVVHLYPADWNGPLRAHPTAWHLKSDEPAEAVKRFAARRRITYILS